MSILTDLDAYRKNLAPNKPDDVIQITTDRKTAEWIAADLRLREKKLSMAVNDPHTKARKRDKKELELHMLTAALQAISTAKKV